MNRRTFLATLAAVPLAAVASPKVEWKQKLFTHRLTLAEAISLARDGDIIYLGQGGEIFVEIGPLHCSNPKRVGVITGIGDA